MTMPPLPNINDQEWYSDWAPAVHTAAEIVLDGRLSEATLDTKYVQLDDFDNAVRTAFTITALTDSAPKTNNTFAADTALSFNAVAGEVLQIDAHLMFNLASGGGIDTDLKVDWTVPAGTTGRWASTQAWSQPGAASTSTGLLVAPGTERDFALQEGDQGVGVRAIFVVGANAGTISPRWAQKTTNAAALTRLAFSNLNCRRLNPAA